MRIWIRTQNDKVLILCEYIYVTGFEIRAGESEGKNYVLGAYDDSEEARDVLDCIQDFIAKGKRVYDMADPESNRS